MRASDLYLFYIALGVPILGLILLTLPTLIKGPKKEKTSNK